MVNQSFLFFAKWVRPIGLRDRADAKRVKHIALVALLGLIGPPVWSQSMTFDDAWARVKTGSDQRAAAQAAVDSKSLQSAALQGLGGPVVSLSGAAYAYHASLDVSLGTVNQSLTQITQNLPTSLLSALTQFNLPSSYTLEQQATGSTKSISAVWPIYMGRVSDTVRAFSAAQGNEAQADADKAEHELATLLVQRYFGAQLAVKAATLRQSAFYDIAQHDAAAAKMLAAGVISRIERLQAQAALDEARRNAQRAQDEAELAAVALTRTVKAYAPVQPETPLFVMSQPIKPLAYFLDQALVHHPGLAKVGAKIGQAEQLHQGQKALRKPQVFAFGQRELETGSADWVAGVGVRWTLFDSVDRDALEASSSKQIEQAEHLQAQARSDISLLVEKNWRLVEQTRLQFLATATGIELAQEVLRLRTAALREGTGTTLELMDADVNQAKVSTERAQLAFNYVMALAQLLESCGLSDEFGRYMHQADLKVN